MAEIHIWEERHFEHRADRSDPPHLKRSAHRPDSVAHGARTAILCPDGVCPSRQSDDPREAASQQPAGTSHQEGVRGLSMR